MKKLTAILLTVVMLFTCLSDTAIAVEYSSEAAGNGYVEVIYDIPIYSMYGYLNSNYAIAITLPNNFGGPQDVTESIRWEAYYAGSKFTLKSGDPYKVLEEPEFNPNAKGGYVDEQLIFFGAFTHGYIDGLWTTLPNLDEYNAATSIRIKATFNIKGGIGNSHINNIDNYSYLQLVDAETYEPVIATAVYGTSWSATVREHHEGNFSPVTGTTHSGYCNLCGKTITEDCSFVGGYCEWCQQKERYAPVYWEPKDSEFPNMSAANEAVLNVKLNKPIVGMAEYTLYAKASADVSDNWFSMSAERVFVDTVSVDGTASELSFRVPTEYIYSGCGFVAFENILLYDSDIMADYMHVDRAKVGNEAGSKGRLSWKAAGDDKLYFDGLPTNYTKLGVQHNYSLNMGADVEAIQYSLTADTSGTYYTLNPANGTVNFGTPTADGARIGFNSISITFDPSKKIVVQEKNKTYAKLDYTKGSISLYKSPGECIWKSNSVWIFDELYFDVNVKAYDNRLYISPVNSTTLLEYNAEYYVVIDPGVITFEDGTSFEGIKPRRWTFKTLTEVEDHEHISDTWKSDEHSHWHICKICGRKYDTEGHKLDSNCRCTVCGTTSHTESLDRRNIKASTCTEKGYTGESYCVICSKTISKGKDIPALGHNTHWVGNSNNPYHWSRCYRCNQNVSQEQHTFENGKCTVCGVNDPSILQSPEGFVRTAWKYVGYTGQEMHDLFGLNSGHYTGNGRWSKEAWCDRFVYFVAKECGLDGAINTPYLSGQANVGKSVSSPQPGDLVFFDWKNGGGIDHVGIVCEVNGDKFGVVHGNYHVSSNSQGVVCGPYNTSLGRSCKFKHGGINYTDYWNVNWNELEKFVRIDWNNIPAGKAATTTINLSGNMMFSIERNGEVLGSNNLRLMALDTEQENAVSFGYYVVNEDGSYEITLDYHNDYNFSIAALEDGIINFDINYYDFDGVLVNFVSFQNVPVTDTTVVETSSFNEFGGYELYLIDIADDDIIGWIADSGETVSAANEEFTNYLNSDEENQPDVEETAQPTPPEHTHFFPTWQYDTTYHWLSCIGCGLTTDLAPHTFVNGVCSICGYVDSGFAADADQSDRIEIDLPTEGLIISEEEVNIEEIIE